VGPVGVEVVRRPGEQDVGGALDEAANHRSAAVVDLVERRHQLVLGVEGDLGQAGEGPPGLLDVEPALGRQDHQGSLGGVADAGAVADDGVVGQRHRHHERLDRQLDVAGHVQDAPGRRVALAVDAVAVARHHELAGRHLVQGQRAGLVGADRGRGPQGLDRAQALDDGALLGQLAGADRQQVGHHGRQARGDGGDGEGDADEEEVVEVLATRKAEHDDQHQRGGRHDRDEHGELVELAGERRLLLLDPAEHPGDVPDLAGHAGGGHDHLAPAPGDLGVHVGHVEAVAERDVDARHGVEALGDRRALPGEARLLDLQRRRHQQPAVGRNLVAGLEAHDVARHQVLGRHLVDLAAPPDAGRDDQHLPQRGHALGRLALLAEPHDGVEHSQGEHDEPGRHVLEGHDADHGRPDQHQLHQVPVLAEEGVPRGLLGLLGQLVGPVAGPALDHLGVVEAHRRVDAQPPAGLVGRQPVPVACRPLTRGGLRHHGQRRAAAVRHRRGSRACAALRRWPGRRPPAWRG
jgi:hypothetical protein